MRVAVTYENGNVFQHFGHTERFKIYEVEGQKVTITRVVNTNGSGHGALADLLRKIQVTDLICGDLGSGAQRALEEAGIHYFGGVVGNADQAVRQLLEGTLVYHTDVTCAHQGEHHQGGCISRHNGTCKH